jgi:hypothetical protein
MSSEKCKARMGLRQRRLKRYRFWKTHTVISAWIATGSLPATVQIAIFAESLNRFTNSAKVLFSFARDSPVERELDHEKYGIASLNQNCVGAQGRHKGEEQGSTHIDSR